MKKFVPIHRKVNIKLLSLQNTIYTCLDFFSNPSRLLGGLYCCSLCECWKSDGCVLDVAVNSSMSGIERQLLDPQ